MNGKRVILAGGSGFLGQALASELIKKNYDVVVLTRGATQARGSIQFICWDGRNLGDWAKVFEDAEAIVNLAGRSVNCRHTPANRREIIDSRVNSVRVIGEAIRASAMPPKVWVQASAIGIYGNTNEKICTETTLPCAGFLTDVCVAWENEFNSVLASGVRRVVLRIGFVLGKNGGALPQLMKLTKSGLGGRVGTGRQMISWIHLDDLMKMFLFAMGEQLHGVFNAVAPAPVTNADFMRELRRQLHRPWSPPAPAFAVKVGARLMGTAPELAIEGCRSVPQRFSESGFQFQFPELRRALHDLLREQC